MAPQPRTRMTVEEYLVFERGSEERHEFDGVEVYAMAGSSREHIQICVNIAGSLYVQMRRRNCTVYNSDMRVYIPQTGLFTYPDVSALCGEPIFFDTHVDTLMNPSVIIEVLSPSTEKYDRGKKFINYRSLESFQEYLLVDQDEVHIMQFTRLPSGMMTYSDMLDLSDSIYLASIDCTLEVADVYEKVDFDKPQP